MLSKRGGPDLCPDRLVELHINSDILCLHVLCCELPDLLDSPGSPLLERDSIQALVQVDGVLPSAHVLGVILLHHLQLCQKLSLLCQAKTPRVLCKRHFDPSTVASYYFLVLLKKGAIPHHKVILKCTKPNVSANELSKPRNFVYLISDSNVYRMRLPQRTGRQPTLRQAHLHLCTPLRQAMVVAPCQRPGQLPVNPPPGNAMHRWLQPLRLYWCHRRSP